MYGISLVSQSYKLPAFFKCQYVARNGNPKKKPQTPHQAKLKGMNFLPLTLKGKLEYGPSCGVPNILSKLLADV